MKSSTDTGFINKHGQINLGPTGKKGSSNQIEYKLQCPVGHQYVANGANISVKRCPLCNEAEADKRNKKPNVRHIPKGGLNLKFDAQTILKLCDSAVQFSTVSDVLLNNYDDQRKLSVITIYLDCGLSMTEKVISREGKLILDRQVHAKQLSLIRPQLFKKFQTEIENILPGCEMHFGVDRGEVLLVNQIDNSVYDVRFQKDRWKTKKRGKPNMHKFRVN